MLCLGPYSEPCPFSFQDWESSFGCPDEKTSNRMLLIGAIEPFRYRRNEATS